MKSKAKPIIPLLLLALLLASLPVLPTSRSSLLLPPPANTMGMVGWGGSGIKSTDCSVVLCNSTFPPSQVFTGQRASSFEMEAAFTSLLGYNAIRASFNPGGSTFPTTGTTPCAPDESGDTFGTYNSTQLQRAIQIASHFALWIIVDYHSYADMNVTYRTCWLNGWRTVVTQFRYSYSMILWEPLNEPGDLNQGSSWANVNYMADRYNDWIYQTRQLGDTHYVIVENLCSNGCIWNVENYWKGYPGAYNNTHSIIDSKKKVYISLHAGMGWNYDYPVHWNTCRDCEFQVHTYYNNTTADQFARYFYLSMRNGTLNTGWPVLNTEGGGLPHCMNNSSCLSLELSSGIPGSAGYTSVTFRFIQTLSNYLSSNNPQYGWVWFPMAQWASADTPGAGTFGVLSPNGGWGTKLAFASTTVLDHGGPRHSL